MEHRIQTSRGEVIVRDTHMFEVVVPSNEQLTLHFHGESTVFRVKGWLDNAKQFGYDGKRLEKPQS